MLSLGELETDGLHSGIPDDRWAFTTRSTPLDYASIAALAAASRVLADYNDALARECLATAQRVWEQEHKRPPSLFHSFNTTGGELTDEEIKAAVELLLATKGGALYRTPLEELTPEIRRRIGGWGWIAVRALPFMDAAFAGQLEAAVGEYQTSLDAELARNPFGVPTRGGGWGGTGSVAAFASRMYFLQAAFPKIVGPDYTLRAVNYLLGTHPVSSVSYL